MNLISVNLRLVIISNSSSKYSSIRIYLDLASVWPYISTSLCSYILSVTFLYKSSNVIQSLIFGTFGLIKVLVPSSMLTIKRNSSIKY